MTFQLTGDQQELQKTIRQSARNIQAEQEKLKEIIRSAEEITARITHGLERVNDDSLNTLSKADRESWLNAEVKARIAYTQLDSVSTNKTMNLTADQKVLCAAFQRARGNIDREISNLNCTLSQDYSSPSRPAIEVDRTEFRRDALKHLADIATEAKRNGAAIKPPGPKS